MGQQLGPLQHLGAPDVARFEHGEPVIGRLRRDALRDQAHDLVALAEPGGRVVAPAVECGQLQRVGEQLAMRLRRTATGHEIADALGVPLHELSAAGATRVLSVEQLRAGAHGSVLDTLAGAEPTEAAFAEAGRLAAEASSPVSDLRGSIDYKRHVVDVYVRRGLARALEMARAA